MSRETFLWPSAREAKEALLLWAGNPDFESFTVSDLTVEELAEGIPQYAPAVLEIIATGEAIAVPLQRRALTRKGRIARVPWSRVRAVWEAPARELERHVFANLPVENRAIEKLIGQRIGKRNVVRATHFAMPPRGPFQTQLQAAGWFQRLGGALAAHCLAYGAWLAGWALMGRAALSGRWDNGWFWGWAILLAFLIPLEALATWWQGWLAITLGGLLKQRLLAGSLEIDTDKVRHQGVGQLLSRVLESDALESLSLTGGAAALLSTIELIATGFVLAQGAAPLTSLILFAAWLLTIGAVAWRYAVRRREWVLHKNRMTHDLVESMNGHRTRIAQQPPSLWHVKEDAALAQYLQVSTKMDRLHAWLMAVGPRGWLVLGMAAVGLEFTRAGAPTDAIVISTGGVLLGYQALRRWVFGIGQCAGAWQSWEMVRELFEAAGRAESSESSSSGHVTPSGKILDVRDLGYAYPGRERPAVADCSLQIALGDRLLLEGTSGSGKSTFGALLAGLRQPSGGLLLAGGLDLATIGAQRWRKLVATAPQYHENHVLSAPLLFNLLMGRSWPASQQDIREAFDVCTELGLGPLLDRMPAGLMEMVGDTGWQLSQGERSRVYLARAVLQGASLVILDESFAALDPETLDQCLQCVLRRAPSLLVIAHP